MLPYTPPQSSTKETRSMIDNSTAELKEDENVRYILTTKKYKVNNLIGKNERKLPKNAEIFKNIISSFENKKPQSINPLLLARKYKIQHRRMYDLFNFLTNFGICRVTRTKEMCWVGLYMINITLKQRYEEIERSSLTKPLKELFTLEPSPCLGSIATKILCLFLFLGIDTLSVRQVVSFVRNKQTDINSLERRSYLVLSYLELLGVIVKSHRRGDYIFVLNRYDLIKDCFFIRMKESAKMKTITVDSLLANESISCRYFKYSMRKAEFEYELSKILPSDKKKFVYQK